MHREFDVVVSLSAISSGISSRWNGMSFSKNCSNYVNFFCFFFVIFRHLLYYSFIDSKGFVTLQYDASKETLRCSIGYFDCLIKRRTCLCFFVLLLFPLFIVSWDSLVVTLRTYGIWSILKKFSRMSHRVTILSMRGGNSFVEPTE